MLEATPAVVIQGAKHTGKTTTASQFAQSAVPLDTDDNSKLLAELDPSMFLAGVTPRLINEWQLVPSIWNHVRRECDDRRESGQFILTESSQPTNDTTRHSGVGRVSRLKLRPLTLFEQGISSGLNRLSDLLEGQETNVIRSEVTFNEVIQAICKGGWPLSYSADMKTASEKVSSYLDEITRGEIVIFGVFDSKRMKRLVRSLSQNVATSPTLRSLRNDVDESMDSRTVTRYLDFLKRIHILEEQLPYDFHARSRAQLRVRPRIHLCDPSLAVVATQSNPISLLGDLEFLARLFKSMVVRDLNVYAEANNARIFFYRDGNDLEIDAIIEDVKGNWLAIEIELGGKPLVESAAKNLLRYQNLVMSRGRSKPKKLIVITATPGYAMDRPDGVAHIPVTSLGP